MALFFGIAPGEEKTAPGIRVLVPEDGERVWMHGKWLELGDDHAVVFIQPGEKCRFVRADGIEKSVGGFPAWIVRGTSKSPAIAMMTNIAQFRGGYLKLGRRAISIAA